MALQGDAAWLYTPIGRWEFGDAACDLLMLMELQCLRTVCIFGGCWRALGWKSVVTECLSASFDASIIYAKLLWRSMLLSGLSVVTMLAMQLCATDCRCAVFIHGH